jgi:hypothetical protein
MSFPATTEQTTNGQSNLVGTKYRQQWIMNAVLSS